jgi:hypothetical protein
MEMLFRAYLCLPDVGIDQPDLLADFQRYYIGTFDSMNALLDELTDIRGCEAVLNEVAANWGFDGLASLDHRTIEDIARETWDIVEITGRLHVFNK